MKFLPLAGAFAAALLAAGAADAATPAQTPAQTTPAKPGSAVNPDEMKAFGQNNLRQQLRDSLAKAGFTSIKIMPSSFYVHAKNKKGEPVEMVIGPDTFTEVTEISTQASAAAPKTGSTQQHASSQK